MPAKSRSTKPSKKSTGKVNKKTAGKAAKKVAKKGARKVAKKGAGKVAKRAAKTVARKSTKKAAGRASDRTKEARQKATEILAKPRHKMIQEAAYFRAENRGFQDSDPVADWLSSEKEVDKLLKRK